MKRKVFKTGNSVVVSLPKEVVEFLGIAPGGDVSVDLDRENRQVVITPLGEPPEITGVDGNFARQVSEFIEAYRPALEALAKR